MACSRLKRSPILKRKFETFLPALSDKINSLLQMDNYVNLLRGELFAHDQRLKARVASDKNFLQHNAQSERVTRSRTHELNYSCKNDGTSSPLKDYLKLFPVT